MAKSRAQKKAERRKRAAQGQTSPVPSATEAQAKTQVPESGEVAEAEAAIEAGALEASAPSETPAEAVSDLPAAAPTDLPTESKRERRRREREEAAAKEERRKARESKSRTVVVEERPRGRVSGFIASCWAELKRVQWPDRETLIQASAVTVAFVAIAAIYLGALDGIFNLIVKQVL